MKVDAHYLALWVLSLCMGALGSFLVFWFWGVWVSYVGFFLVFVASFFVILYSALLKMGARWDED